MSDTRDDGLLFTLDWLARVGELRGEFELPPRSPVREIDLD